ncbi:MAG: hypothetical protein ACKO5R_07815 [Planctomycetaceae bacterium]
MAGCRAMDANPFTARRIAPGAIPYRFDQTGQREALVEACLRLPAAAIVGPHGTGKTTLLCTLRWVLERRAGPVALLTLGDGATRGAAPPLPAGLGLPRALVTQAAARPAWLVVDGFEQWGLWRRVRVVLGCRRAGVRLLVTAHGACGVPIVHRTAVTPRTVAAIHDGLVQDRPTHVAVGDLALALERQGGNLREALFDCYDLHERGRSEPEICHRDASDRGGDAVAAMLPGPAERR